MVYRQCLIPPLLAFVLTILGFHFGIIAILVPFAKGRN